MAFLRYLIFLFALPLSVGGFSQISISGKVLDESGKPLMAASVFLASTSFGTVANNLGEFHLPGFAHGKYDLVVSCMGYQTFSQSIDTRQINAPLTIVLKVKADELENVTIGPGEESTWEKWGKFFTDNFIGTMPGSFSCKIENQSVLRFRHFSNQNLIRVTASRPLIITNKSLGYTITYQMEYFQYDFDSKLLYYLGYPLFKQMDPKNEHQYNRWEANRKEAYYGSQLHFLRSLYRNAPLQEGFEMRKLVKQPNLEKERVKKLMRMQVQSGGPVTITMNGNSSSAMATRNRDSTGYYQKILSQPDFTDILYSPVLPGDTVAFQINPHTAGMEFTDYLQITYVKAREHPEYPPIKGQGQKRGFQQSTIKMTEPQTLEIAANGQVNDPLIILMTGYWGWKDKMATMLPFDYWPPKEKK